MVPRTAFVVLGIVTLVGLLALAGCPHAAGGYAKNDRAAGGEVDRGETNGKTFDFVSNKPEGDDWTIRIRGSALWASYAHGEATETLGSANMSERDTNKLWNLVDKVDLPTRKKGKRDQDDGFVTMVLREPGGGDDGDHKLYTVNISRTTKDDAVIDLADFLGDLIKKYYKKKGKPEF